MYIDKKCYQNKWKGVNVYGLMALSLQSNYTHRGYKNISNWQIHNIHWAKHKQMETNLTEVYRGF